MFTAVARMMSGQPRFYSAKDGVFNTSDPSTWQSGTVVLDAPVIMYQGEPIPSHTNQEYIFSFVVPGVKKENLKVELSANELTVSLSLVEELEENSLCSSFEHTIFLEPDADLDKIGTKLKDGILKIVVAKRQKKEPETKKLEIK